MGEQVTTGKLSDAHVFDNQEPPQSAPLPEWIWIIDRDMIDLPDEFAANVKQFFVVDQPIIFQLQRRRTRDWKWRQPRKHTSRFVFNDDEKYFTLRGFGGYGSMYWCAERRRSRTSKHFELLTLDLNPLFFRSASTAKTVVQFADQVDGLQWMPAAAPQKTPPHIAAAVQ